MTNRNPFYYGGPVGGDMFAARLSDVNTVVERLRNHIGVVVTGPRRYGKSSLIKQAFAELTQDDVAPAIVHVNLLRAGSLSAASELLIKGLHQVPGSSWLDNATEFMKKLRIQPTMTLEDGKHTFSFGVKTAAADLSRVFDDVYENLDEISAERPAVLFLDEFQAVLGLDEHLPGRLKALADTYKGVSLVLAGSKHHVMKSLVLSEGAPLYDMLQQVALGPIPEDDWVPFLMSRVTTGGKSFDSEATVRKLCVEAGPIPYNVQQLAFEAFSQASTQIDQVTVMSAVAQLVRNRNAEYSDRLENLSSGNIRVLKVLANGNHASVGSAEFAVQVDLANSTSVRWALRKLEEDDCVVKRNGRYRIDDPFFLAWLRDLGDEI